MDSILILAPHPDDEVLGCGGIIRKYRDQGKQVYVLIITRGKPGIYDEKKITNIRNEALAAHKVLGVSETVFLGFPAPELDLISVSELARAISKVIERFTIDTLFIPHHGDIHHDHKAVYNAGLVAGRPVNENTVKKIYVYETLSETEWAPPTGNDAFIPNFFIDIEKEFNHKIEAMKCYQSQLRAFPSSRSLKSLESLANLRGSTVGCHCAEAFMVVRIIGD